MSQPQQPVYNNSRFRVVDYNFDTFVGPQAGDPGSPPMSIGEAVQSIFAVVQSLDCCSSESGHREELMGLMRSLVYRSLKDHLSAVTAAASAQDVLHSEIQIQLVEMMMTLGKQKWIGWESGEREDLHIPVYSRLVSHFSTTWADALTALDPEGFATFEDTSRSIVNMAHRADDADKSTALWKAVTTILVPQFGDGSLRESSLAAAMAVVSHGNLDDMSSAIDEYSSLFGSMPQASWDSIDAMLGHDDVDGRGLSNKQAVLALLVTLFGDGDARLDADMIVPLLADGQFSVQAALALTSARAASSLPARAIKTMCTALRDDAGLTRKVPVVDKDSGATFKCPVRVLVFAHLVAQLVLSGESMFARAAYITFEFVSLERSLRLRDSAASVVDGLLAGVATIDAGGASIDQADDGIDHPAVLRAKRTLSAIIREAPALCSDALNQMVR